MRNMLLALCLMFAGCGQRPPPPEFLNEGLVTGTAHYHWEHFPIRVVMPQDIPPQYRNAVVQGILYWNTITDRNIFVIVEGGGEPSLDIAPGSVLVVFSTLPIGYLGVTWDDADIFTGYVDNSLVIFNAFQYSESEMWKTAVHEFGHVLGLEHDDDIRSVMYFESNSQQDRVEPEDIEYVRYEYDQGHH